MGQHDRRLQRPNRRHLRLNRQPRVVGVHERHLSGSVPSLKLARRTPPRRSEGSLCGQGRRRSVDLWFFRPALYRLSYLTIQSRSLRKRLAGTTGFEPATSGLTGRRTLQTVLRSRDLPEMPGMTGEVYRSGDGAQDDAGLGRGFPGFAVFLPWGAGANTPTRKIRGGRT